MRLMRARNPQLALPQLAAPIVCCSAEEYGPGLSVPPAFHHYVYVLQYYY